LGCCDLVEFLGGGVSPVFWVGFLVARFWGGLLDLGMGGSPPVLVRMPIYSAS